jgi:hypothetical protein
MHKLPSGLLLSEVAETMTIAKITMLTSNVALNAVSTIFMKLSGI